MLKKWFLLIAMAAYVAPATLRAAEAPVVHEGTAATVEHTTATVEHGTPGDEHEEKAQLIPDPHSRETQLQALWVVIIFVILLAVLYPTAWKNVLAGLKAREQRIRQDIADAEAARAKAEATLKDYNAQLATAEGKIRDMMAKASADAEKLATSLRMQAQQEVEEIKERSTKEIDAARKAALADIYAQAADLSTSIASKILRRNLNPDDQKTLVNESLSQLQTVKA